MALLEICNLTKSFGNFTAVNNVNITIEAGEFFTLLGPSGCGKTTLLRMLAGFDLPDSGQILLDNKNIVKLPPEKRPIHTVFQNYALFPHMTVAENLGFPLKMSGKTMIEINSRVEELLSKVHLSGFAERYPHELSGGQKQRVAFARGLINQPRLLLLDEPLGALDAKLREEMQIELVKLQQEAGITFIFVTHAQNEALALSHRMAVMNHGRIEQIDQPSIIYGFPKNKFVAGFIGKTNLIDAQILEVTPSCLKLNLSGLGEVTVPGKGEVQVGDKGTMAVRPEQVQLLPYSEEAKFKGYFRGKIHDSLYLGNTTSYIVELANSSHMEALVPNFTPGQTKFFEMGDLVLVVWKFEAGVFLNE